MLRVALAGCALLVVLSGCERVAKLASGTPLQSFESRCESLPGGSFQIRRLPIAVSENYSMTYAQLARLSEPSAVNHRTVGLTRAKFGYRSSLELEGIEDAQGSRACIRAKIRIDIEATGMTVYVAWEYHGDACREPLILEHERKHVAVFDRYAEESVGALTRELDARFGGGVRHGTSIAGVQEALKKELAVHLEAFMERARDELDWRHAQIDTPFEYERMARTCGEERAAAP